VTATATGPSRQSRPSRSVLRRPSTLIALGVLAAVAFLVAFGGALAPFGPLSQDVNAIQQGPSWHHLLGTDYLGRDVLSRLMAGTRLSVLAALEAVGLGLVIGTLPGIAAAVTGRWLDWALSRVFDALMTLPSIIFAVSVTAAIGNSLTKAMLPIGILLAPLFFRVVRTATLEFAHAEYVEAATLLGATQSRIIRVHIWRKVLPTVAVTTAMAAAAALLTVSFLTFLSIGVQPPTPTWGGVLSSDLDYLAQSPWAPFIPGALIAVTVGALNTLADALRDRRSSYLPATATQVGAALLDPEALNVDRAVA
jgi:peptide/nickel transport system permease protein